MPAAQFFYATFALPLRSPWLAAALAVGSTRVSAVVPWVIVAYAAVRVLALLGWATGRTAAGARACLSRVEHSVACPNSSPPSRR